MRSVGWRYGVAVLMVACLVQVFAGATSAQERYVDLEVIKALREGGHVLIMRHAEANPDQFDQDPRNFRVIKRQQQLTERGRTSARAFGTAVRSIGTRIGDVHTSLFHRAFETAVEAGYKGAKATIDLTEGSLVASPNEQRRRAAGFRRLIVAPMATGTTRLIVSHRVNIAQALGKEWYDVKEGEVSIFRIDKGAYALLARIQIDEWSRLVSASKS